MGNVPSIIEHTTPADGNVFLDLGFEPEEAARLLAKAEKQYVEKLRKESLMTEI